MAIDLKLLEIRIDNWLGEETEESIREWLLAQRTNLSTSDEALPIADVSGSVIKPPIGLIPKRFYEERVRVERFNQVCGAISRYYNAGLKINIEWIEEYNDLVESVGKHYR